MRAASEVGLSCIHCIRVAGPDAEVGALLSNPSVADPRICKSMRMNTRLALRRLLEVVFLIECDWEGERLSTRFTPYQLIEVNAPRRGLFLGPSLLEEFLVPFQAAI